ncbi:chemotaxis protein CheA [Radiobacillus deserti]|uniref:Chemotaxis protein CheA n=1 Tax=Radiobacillus deserti TaxID=2594883 RepID=A0A516KFR3_9BACI|nr:chemotaxis protein CheA [Radiobacillus deserti]QDP40196.1 chemotaxis protein CheA [Radiobacillus deserti]
MNEYLEVFIEESKEHIQALNDNLLVLEKNPTDIGMVNEIFRSAHTLKGMSATMGYQDLANLTHKLENVLDAVRNNQLKVSSEMLDVVFEAVDHLEEMVMDIASGGEGKRNVETVVTKLQAIEAGEDISNASSTQKEVVPSSTQSGSELSSSLDEFELAVLKESEEKNFNIFELNVSLREDCMLKAARVYMVFEILEQEGEVIKSNPLVQDLEEENFEQSFSVLLVSKTDAEVLRQKVLKVSEIEEVLVQPFSLADISAKQQAPQTSSTNGTPTSNESATNNASSSAKESGNVKIGNKTIRVNIDRLDALMNLFEELVIDRGRLEQISLNLKHNELQETVERMSRISGDLQNIILNMRMVPIDQVFNRFPRMVRQLAKDLGKQINLEIIGAETELDRTVIDEIGDPLVHLIRNSLDHGVETPETRTAKGKPAEGSLTLKAYHSGNHVFIEITDDGAGINKEKVINKAISNGIIKEEQASSLTDQQVFELIMASGFSTADKISDVSGRGVGLDVVKNTIESLGGTITIESEQDKGSVFSIQLPLTLSIISVLLVEVQKEKYAVPLSSIIETVVVHKDDIMQAHKKSVIDFRGKVVPLIPLEHVFQVPEQLKQDDYYSIVIVRKGEKMAGLIVDSFIGQQEVVLKSLGEYLSDVFAISGATILGDGQVALIIDSNALVK